MPIALPLINEPIVYLLKLQPCFLHKFGLVIFLCIAHYIQKDESMFLEYNGYKCINEWGSCLLTVGYGHFECCCHQFFSTVVVSPGNFPALLFLKISSLTSSILDLKPCKFKRHKFVTYRVTWKRISTLI